MHAASRKPFPQQTTPPAPESHGGTYQALRARRFKALLDKFSFDAIGLCLNMAKPKLEALAEGRLSLGPELCQFIETELGLPGGYLDGDASLPSTLAGLNPHAQEELAKESQMQRVTVQSQHPVSPPPAQAPSPAAPLVPQQDHLGTPRLAPESSVAVSPPVTPAPTDLANLPPMIGQRVANLRLLAGGWGHKTAIAKLTGIQDSYISRLLAVNTHGFRPLSDNQARRIEVAVGLPAFWFDLPREEVPADVVARFAEQVVKRPPRSGDDLNAAPAAARPNNAKAAAAPPPNAEPARGALSEEQLSAAEPPAAQPSSVAQPPAAISHLATPSLPSAGEDFLVEMLLETINRLRAQGRFGNKEAYELLGALVGRT